MSLLGRPAVLAGLLVAAAVCLHPALGAEAWLPGRQLVLAALLPACAAALAAAALAAGPSRRAAAALAACGAVLAVTGAGLDGVKGRHGTLRLVVGQAGNSFEESGPEGQALGLRPFGFSVAVARVTATGGVALAVPGRAEPVEVTSRRAAAFSGFRFASPRVSESGGVTRLRVSASDGTHTDVVDLGPGAPGRAGGLVISLDQYFPDFALDDRQQPFTRSLESRNPAALLTVERGGQSYRAFVIQSLPGVHRVEPLGLTFSLLGVEPEQQVELAVHREPFAAVVLIGGVLLALGVGLGALRAPTPEPPAGTPGLAGKAVRATGEELPGGLVYVLALLLADGARVTSWSFGVPTAAGRVVLPAVGVLLGLSLLAAAGGTLWLAAQSLAGQNAPRAAGRAALWGAALLGAAGLLLAVVRLALLPEATPGMVLPVAGVALALGLLVAGLRGLLVALFPAAVVLAILAAIVAGVSGSAAAGTYATASAMAAAATALLGLAALAPVGFVAVARLVFQTALLALFLRPI
jgi:hypothetical protein